MRSGYGVSPISSLESNPSLRSIGNWFSTSTVFRLHWCFVSCSSRVILVQYHSFPHEMKLTQLVASEKKTCIGKGTHGEMKCLLKRLPHHIMKIISPRTLGMELGFVMQIITQMSWDIRFVPVSVTYN